VRIETPHLALEPLQRRNFGVDFGARAGWQQRIVLMEAGRRARHGIEPEHQFAEKAVGQLVELRIASLPEARAGQCEKEKDAQVFHGKPLC